MSGTRFFAGTADITPIRPAILGGYKNRFSPFEAVADPLEGNAILLGGKSSRIFIVTVDALYPGRLLRDRLLTELRLAESELFLAASHTHFAPMMCPDMPGLGTHDLDYIEFVTERLVTLIRSLEARAGPVECSYHQGLAHHSINRRLSRWRLTKAGINYTCGMGPNSTAEKDERVFGLRFDAGHEPKALLWNYACHPTDFPRPSQVSADFPGVVRSRLRKVHGNIPVLFLQGFSGDIRPAFMGVSGIKSALRRVLQGPQFRTPGMAEWRAWADDLATQIESIFRTGNSIALSDPYSERFEVAEEALGSSGRGDKPLLWHHLDCGGFGFLGTNAEPVTAYRRLVEPFFAGKPLLTAGCIDQTHGYLPVDAMLSEGGYEVQGFRDLFSYKTQFQLGVEAAAIAPLRHALGR